MPASLCLPNLGGGTVCLLQCQMRITCRTEALLIGLALLLTAIDPAVAIDNVVLQWNEATLDAIRNTKSAPPIAARAFAITDTAMFDAWAACDPVAKGTRLGSSSVRSSGPTLLLRHSQATSPDTARSAPPRRKCCSALRAATTSAHRSPHFRAHPQLNPA